LDDTGASTINHLVVVVLGFSYNMEFLQKVGTYFISYINIKPKYSWLKKLNQSLSWNFCVDVGINGFYNILY